MFTREHLIEYLVDNVTDRLLQNILNSGRVESLGWFDPLPYTNTPGFVVKLTSYRKKTYVIAVSFKEIVGKPYWFRLKNVPWSAWKGDDYSDELHRGDFPEQYRRKMKDDN